METITPLMRAMMEALDKAQCNMTGPELATTLAYMGHRDRTDVQETALFGLVFDELVSESATLRGDVYTQVFGLTDAGCDALWALQKADAVALVSPQHQASAMRQLNARPVSFNTREEMRWFLSGAKA